MKGSGYWRTETDERLAATKFRSAERRRGARYYDSEIGRWLSINLLADKLAPIKRSVSGYPGWSGYNYVENNPLIFIDEKGDRLKSVKMVGLTSDDPILKERTYYLDDNIVDNVQAFVQKARAKFPSISVNNTFRLERSSIIKTTNTKAKGLSRHNAGFAIDLNGVSKLTKKELKELNKMAKGYGLRPLKNQSSDYPHFSADYKKYFKSLKTAVEENKKHYIELTNENSKKKNEEEK